MVTAQSLAIEIEKSIGYSKIIKETGFAYDYLRKQILITAREVIAEYLSHGRYDVPLLVSTPATPTGDNDGR